MSVLDQFRDAEQRIAQRLKELEPAVAEYRELEVVAQRLGIDVSSTARSRCADTPAQGRRGAHEGQRRTGGAGATSPARCACQGRQRDAGKARPAPQRTGAAR